MEKTLQRLLDLSLDERRKRNTMEEQLLKQVHEIELEILDEIIMICESNKIQYFMYEGSLLGAVRHQGFIPWDDDIDIAMPREDYERFLKLAPSYLSQNLILQSIYTDSNWGKVFSKIRNIKTEFKSKSDGEGYISYGIFVDIFPLDNINKSSFQISRIEEKIIKTLKEHLILYIEKKHKNIPHLFMGILPIQIYKYLFRKIANRRGNYLTCYGSEYGVKRETFSKDLYFPPKIVEFEGRRVWVPGQYEIILTNVYGDDYMELPPPEKRYSHEPVFVSINEKDS